MKDSIQRKKQTNKQTNKTKQKPLKKSNLKQNKQIYKIVESNTGQLDVCKWYSWNRHKGAVSIGFFCRGRGSITLNNITRYIYETNHS